MKAPMPMKRLVAHACLGICLLAIIFGEGCQKAKPPTTVSFVKIGNIGWANLIDLDDRGAHFRLLLETHEIQQAKSDTQPTSDDLSIDNAAELARIDKDCKTGRLGIAIWTRDGKDGKVHLCVDQTWDGQGKGASYTVGAFEGTPLPGDIRTGGKCGTTTADPEEPLRLGSIETEDSKTGKKYKSVILLERVTPK